MHNTSSFVLALVILCSPITALCQGDFSSPATFVKATLKNDDLVSVETKGDLSSDGLEDWAGVIHRQKSGSAPTYQLYILLRLPQGGYRVAVNSQEAPIPGMGCCWVEDLRISNSSLYIQNNAKTATTMEVATHQFKLYKGGWRLVGVKIYYDDHGSKIATTDTDMNLLTGLVIEKKQRGNNKPIVTSRRKKFPTSFLKDFDFYNGFGVESDRRI